MRAPEFWWQPEPNLAARLLAPLGAIYGAVCGSRMGRRGHRISLPVLCVGNFVAGGAGKTPTAIAIAHRLLAKGEQPVFLSRGYRGKAFTEPCLIDLARHSALDVGDEALLLARVAPTIIGSDRPASAKLAETIGASLLLLDDGLQNPSLVQDLRLAVIDGGTGVGNGLCIPAGPLRASLSTQMDSVSAVLFIESGTQAAGLRDLAQTFGKPILNAHFKIEKETSISLARQKLMAFAGIGLPEKFRATLQNLDAEIVGWRSFPDHYVYSVKTLRSLQTEAQGKHARLITTEKDFVRIKPLLHDLDKNLPYPEPLPIEIIFEEDVLLDDLLTRAIGNRLR
jgi:tetraacyldisaccharide 4'-kinase